LRGLFVESGHQLFFVKKYIAFCGVRTRADYVHWGLNPAP
jgi:hypothetical protein